MDLTAILGLLVGLGIGFICRWFDLPLPAPPKIVGALLVVAMTLGFLTGQYIQGPELTLGQMFK